MLSKVIKIAKRDYKASVRSKAFIIGLVLAPILMGGSLIVFAIMKDRVDVSDRHMLILDHSGQIAEGIISAADYRNEHEIFDENDNKIKPSYYFSLAEPESQTIREQRLELSDKVRSAEINGFLEIGSAVVSPGNDPENAYVHYYANNAAMDDVRGWLNWPVNNSLRKIRLEKAGIDEKDVGDLFTWANTEAMGLVTVDEGSGEIQEGKKASELEALLVPIILMMFMFLMIMMTVPPMLQSVMEEKTQGIAEVLLGSVEPFEFMMGKVLSGIAVALTSSAVYIIGAVFMVNYMDVADRIPLDILPWFLAYMLLAIIMMGSISTGLGATCSEAKDAQSLTFPAIMPMMIPLFVYLPVIKEPVSTFSTVLSLIPPFTPLLMLLRQATPEAIPAWQPWVGLIGVIAFSLLFVWIGSRIFRVAILVQGTPPKLSNIIRWGLKG